MPKKTQAPATGGLFPVDIDNKFYIIVCGMQRSGTAQVADLLRHHPYICLQGELHPGWPQAAQMLLDYDNWHGVTKHQPHDGKNNPDLTKPNVRIPPKFHEVRLDMAVRLYAFHNKGKWIWKSDRAYHGFKTPNVELKFKRLNESLNPSFDTVHYFYCIRNFKSTYISYQSMIWAKHDCQQYTDVYIRSLNNAIKMRELSQKKKQKFAITVSHLDDYIKAGDGQTQWIRKHLYEPLGMDLSAEEAQAIIAASPNKKEGSVEDRAAARPKGLSDEDARYLEGRKNELTETIDLFNQTFGTRLLTGL